jgi:hypothetical protein
VRARECSPTVLNRVTSCCYRACGLVISASAAVVVSAAAAGRAVGREVGEEFGASKVQHLAAIAVGVHQQAVAAAGRGEHMMRCRQKQAWVSCEECCSERWNCLLLIMLHLLCVCRWSACSKLRRRCRLSELGKDQQQAHAVARCVPTLRLVAKSY